MGSGHGQHSKFPNHGSSASQIKAELTAASNFLKAVRKSLARANTRRGELPPDAARTQPWVWDYQQAIDLAIKDASNLKVAIDKAMAIGPEVSMTKVGSDVPGRPSRPRLPAPEEKPRCAVCGLEQFHVAGGQLSCERNHLGAQSLTCPDLEPGRLQCHDVHCEACAGAAQNRLEMSVDKERRKQWKSGIVKKDY